MAHNTVLVNKKNQIRKGRGGEVIHFKTFERVKVMEMASSAYSETSVYKRTSVLVDHGNGQNYVVDFFRVEGGETQDYVFHASGEIQEIKGITPTPEQGNAIYDFSDVKTAQGNGVWLAKWQAGEQMAAAWSVGQEGEKVFTGKGWGQRDWKNEDIGATIS